MKKQSLWDTAVLSLYRPLRFLGIFIIIAAALMMQQFAPENFSAPLDSKYLPAMMLLIALFWGGWFLFQYASKRDSVSFLKKEEQRIGERLFLYEALYCEKCGKKRIAINTFKNTKNGNDFFPILPGEEPSPNLRGFYCANCKNIVPENKQRRQRIHPNRLSGGARFRVYEKQGIIKRYRLDKSVIGHSIIMMIIAQVLWIYSIYAMQKHFYLLLLCMIASYLFFNFTKLFLTNLILQYQICEDYLLVRRLSGIYAYPWISFQKVVCYKNLKRMPDRVAFFTQYGNFFIPKFVKEREQLEEDIISRSKMQMHFMS